MHQFEGALVWYSTSSFPSCLLLLVIFISFYFYFSDPALYDNCQSAACFGWLFLFAVSFLAFYECHLFELTTVFIWSLVSSFDGYCDLIAVLFFFFFMCLVSLIGFYYFSAWSLFSLLYKYCLLNCYYILLSVLCFVAFCYSLHLFCGLVCFFF